MPKCVYSCIYIQFYTLSLMKLSWRWVLHQTMSSMSVVDSLCLVFMWEVGTKSPQNLYRETKCDCPSGTMRQTWFKVPIKLSTSFDVWYEPWVQVDKFSRYLVFFCVGNVTSFHDKSHWKPIYIETVEKSTNFVGAHGQPSSSVIFHIRVEE